MRTLYSYLGRELAKVTALALLAFTLIMTVFAIIEPLRRYGLEVEGVLWLVALTLPTMMSLTLPIAALFAATIVYGRFSQDNEMVACRASGISSLSILAPALVLGGIVTVVSMLLNNFATPQIVKTAETALKANARNLAYHRLRSKSGVRWEGKSWIIHADSVDDAANRVEGVVVAMPKLGNKKGEMDIVVAPTASVGFTNDGNDTWLTLDAQDVTAISTRQGEYSVPESSVRPPPLKLPRLVEESPAWYDWPTLVRILRNPAESQEIRSYLAKIRTLLCHEMLARQIAGSINSGNAYRQLADYDGKNSYYVDAGSARVGKEGVVDLSAGRRAGKLVPVEVVVVRSGRPYQVVTAETGRVEAKTSQVSEMLDASPRSLVTIELPDGAEVRTLSEGAGDAQHRQSWSVGQLPVPDHLVQKARAVPLDEICSRAEELTGDRKFMDVMTRQLNGVIEKLTRKVKAEINVRLAYSLSCLLMVAMGAALGLVLRGGQIVSAFAISVIPAALVIALMLTGKEMARNPAVSVSLGLAVIWGGVLLLLAVDAAVYFGLSRR